MRSQRCLNRPPKGRAKSGTQVGTPAIPGARRRVTVRGSAGQPILYAHVENGVLFVDVESYAGPTDPGGPDIEFMAQIAG